MTDTANAPERDDELLPCPFCGGEAWYNIDHTTELCNSVWCRACDFGVFDPNGTGSSVAAWNRRTHCDELVAAADEEAFARGVNWAQEKARVEGRLVIVDSPELATLRADLAEAQEKIARLTEALKKYEDTLCEGFCGDCPRGYVDKSMLRDCGGCLARAALQKNANE